MNAETRQENRKRPAPDVLARMKERAPKAFQAARLVGKWIWVEFSDKPDPETRAALNELGFSWNPKRLAWQNPCGAWCSKQARSYHPKDKYGEVRAADLV